MTEQFVLTLDSEAAARLKRLAAETGESFEDLARHMLEDAARDIAGDLGDDAELARRVEVWRQTRASVDSASAHAWLQSLDSEDPAQRPSAKRA